MRPSPRQRALAIVALIGVVALLAAVIAFLLRNGGFVVLGVAGLFVAAAGGWWATTRRMPRRAFGIVGLVVGAGMVVGALVGAVAGAEQIVLRLVIVVLLFAITTVAARGALLDDGTAQEEPGRWHRGSVPRHPVLLCNPWSGGGKVEQFGLVGLAAELGVETVLLDHGLDLAQLAKDAISRGADCLGMAGGDGSQALVASIASEHGIPFVCISAGTRNHFALDLGIDRDDPRKGMRAFLDAVERRVDYATVNGRLFVNNVSLGVYATIVQQESYRQAKVETSKNLLPELLGQTEQPFDLQFTTPGGDEVDGSFLIMVSNNPYVLGPSFDISQRRRLDSGRLGVVAVSAGTGREAAAVVTLAAIGQGGRSGQVHQFETDRFEVRSRSGRAFAGIDGEALDMETPLRFEIHPLGLRLLVPEGNQAVARRRRIRGAKPKDLLSIAQGRRP